MKKKRNETSINSKESMDSLFGAWRKKPNSVDSSGNKLSLVNCNINNIDTVPEVLAKKINVLFLSNNYISNLSNIKQFENLHTLSIANNCIHYIHQLDGLKQCSNLLHLTINDNKVTKMPFFREYLFHCCPKLTLLNGIKVHHSYDNANINSIINSFKYQINQLCLNELRVCILSHWNKLLRCHMELISVVVGGWRSIRGKHIATHTKTSMNETDCFSMLTGVHMLLQIALYGGVYKYLQSFCYAQYYTSVQDLCYRKSEFVLKQKKHAQPSYYNAKSSIALSGYNDYFGSSSCIYWNSNLAEILADQQQYIFMLASECESSVLERKMSANACIDDKTTHTTILNCLQQINFESNDSEFSGFDGKVYCGIKDGSKLLKIDKENKMNEQAKANGSEGSRYEQLLSQYNLEEQKLRSMGHEVKSKSFSTKGRGCNALRPNSGSHEDEPPPPPPPLNRSLSSSSRPPKGSKAPSPCRLGESEGIALHYQPGAPIPTNPTVVTSNNLPPPPPPTTNPTVVTRNTLPSPPPPTTSASSALQEIESYMKKAQAELECPDDSCSWYEAIDNIWQFTDEDRKVFEIIQSEYEASQNRLQVSVDSTGVDSGADSQRLVPIESLLSKRESMKCVTDMNIMRKEIAKLHNYLYNSEDATAFYNAFNGYATRYQELLGVYKREKNKKELSLLKLQEFHHNSIGIRSELQMGKRWIASVSDIAARIEGAYERLESAKLQRLDDILKLEEEYSNIDRMEDIKTRALGTLGAIVNEMKQLSRRLTEETPQMQQTIYMRQMEYKAIAHYERGSVLRNGVVCRSGRLTTSKYYFDMWKLRVRRQLRIKRFTAHRIMIQGIILMKTSFVCLLLHRNKEKRLRQSYIWVVRGRTQRHFFNWYHASLQSQRIRFYIRDTKRKKQLKSAISMLKMNVKTNKVSKAKDYKLSLLYTCYLVNRIFVCWKKYTKHKNRYYSEYPSDHAKAEEKYNRVVYTYKLSKIFLSWKRWVVRRSGVRARSCERIISYQRTKALHVGLFSWFNYTQAIRYLRYHLKCNATRKLHASMERSVSTRRQLFNAENYYWNQLKHQCIRRWYVMFAKKRRLLRNYNRIKTHSCINTLLSRWLRWIHIYKYSVEIRRVNAIAINKYINALLKKCYGGWKEFTMQQCINKAKDMHLNILDSIEYETLLLTRNGDKSVLAQGGTMSSRNGRLVQADSVNNSIAVKLETILLAQQQEPLYGIASDSENEMDCTVLRNEVETVKSGRNCKIYACRSRNQKSSLTCPRYISNLLKRWRIYSRRRRCLHECFRIVSNKKSKDMLNISLRVWTNIWLKNLHGNVKHENEVLNHRNIQELDGNVIEAAGLTYQLQSLKNMVSDIKMQMSKSNEVYKDRQVQVDDLIAEVTDRETKIYEFESKAMEYELEGKSLHFKLSQLEEKCEVLMDESKSILIQYNILKEYGQGSDGVPGSVPLSPSNEILHSENLENEKLLGELYSRRSQLYVDMELLYNKAILVQTRGFEEITLIKQCQEDEVAIKSQLEGKIALINAQISEESCLIGQARESLAECSHQLSSASVEFAQKNNRLHQELIDFDIKETKLNKELSNKNEYLLELDEELNALNLELEKEQARNFEVSDGQFSSMKQLENEVRSVGIQGAIQNLQKSVDENTLSVKTHARKSQLEDTNHSNYSSSGNENASLSDPEFLVSPGDGQFEKNEVMNDSRRIIEKIRARIHTPV